jgi:hypothetical protein
VAAKEARFKVKKGETCDLEKVKEAVKDAGNYQVVDVKVPKEQAKEPPAKSPPPADRKEKTSK